MSDTPTDCETRKPSKTKRKTVIGATPNHAASAAFQHRGDWDICTSPYPVGGLFGTRFFADYWAVDLTGFNGSPAAPRRVMLSRIKDLEDRAEAAKAEVERLREAGDALSFAAQTTGGTAGRDEGVVTAIEGWTKARAALREGEDG